jgi:hypothetical protein
MSRKIPVTVLFSCPKCGLGYQAMQEHVPKTIAGRFVCMDCAAEVHTWSGFYDFIVWKPMKMEPQKGKLN